MISIVGLTISNTKHILRCTTDTTLNTSLFYFRLIKIDEDESKEKCVYFMEDKNQDELFEVLELDVDDNENVEVNEEYQDELTDGANVAGNCETIASK